MEELKQHLDYTTARNVSSGACGLSNMIAHTADLLNTGSILVLMSYYVDEPPATSKHNPCSLHEDISWTQTATFSEHV
jgi:hypothetical protein